jgi:hypothetical protein
MRHQAKPAEADLPKLYMCLAQDRYPFLLQLSAEALVSVQTSSLMKWNK